MTLIEPDYQGGGIVNLMSSIIRARGGQSHLPEARVLPAAELEPYRHLMLIIIDGLGAEWLSRHAPDGLLNNHQIGALTSVFPSTTAAAVGSFLTGVAPIQHGITGWFTWLRELGCVMTVLPGVPRCGGAGDWAGVPDLRALFPCPPVFDRIDTTSTLVSPHHIAHSAFNRAHQGRAKVRVYRKLRGFFEQLEQSARRTRQPSLIIGYWPELDHLGHEHGIHSDQARKHFLALESGIKTLSERLAGTETCLLVTADHGQIDIQAEDAINLSDRPGLADCLRLPLCGEPRAAFCYLAKTIEDAEQRLTTALGDSFQVLRSQDLLARGYFGPDHPHPEIQHRIGDLTLIGRNRHVVRDRLLTERPFRQVGVHGGLSGAEMLVPLCRLLSEPHR